jgi:uncharacterized protein with HEPN domain
MFKASHKDSACLLNIQESVSRIKQYTELYDNADSLYADSKSFDAVLMNFIVIGEMAEKLSEDFRQSTEAKIDWFKIRGLRNIISHNYFGIDAEEIWQIIQDSLIRLDGDIRLILEK